ncbi:MAG TPA: hypothetical protein ENI19_03820 [Candidatus Nealsonbacteria bacterium]|uniref:Uncharacterized protein n=1 Tax=marine sediment metagenome TaxID=412755 RepID=A0A0F9VC94_9ZZZZ|nr:hypothetical protein [Candidatus Nealsonbacteria bacterium]HEB46798.1 hypothetical protein [Candidatus Nealsonbacteria bacterium]
MEQRNFTKIPFIIATLATIILLGIIVYQLDIFTSSTASISDVFQKPRTITKEESQRMAELQEKLKNAEELMQEIIEGGLMDYRSPFQSWCDEKYNKLEEEWERRLKESGTKAVQEEMKIKEETCKKYPEFFKIDNIFFCSGGKLEKHIRDIYIPKCISWITNQLEIP